MNTVKEEKKNEHETAMAVVAGSLPTMSTITPFTTAIFDIFNNPVTTEAFKALHQRV